MNFSVVIPAHNAGRYLEATLDSMAAQTVPPVEVIVVDDGSTDGTGDTAANYRFRDGSAPTVIRHDTPLGVAASRNDGVAHAGGDWVGLCDQDDIWHPARIETVLNATTRYPDADALSTGLTSFAFTDDRARMESHQRMAMVDHWVTDDKIATLVPLAKRREGPAVQVSIDDLRHDTLFATTSVCYRRGAYSAAGGAAVWSHLCDDYVLNCGIALTGRLYSLPDVLIFYRVRPGSGSHGDESFALAYLATNLAMKLAPARADEGPAGPTYRHMLLVRARDGAPLSQLVAFAVLGRIGVRSTLRVVKSSVKAKLRAR